MLIQPFLAMHIPDGFLSVPVALAGWILSVVLIAFALRQSRAALGDHQVALMGIMAAFVFAAQMINFPVAGGTSGHLIGGTLVAIILGPWAAVLVMTCVIAVQALLFQDGGLLALGFNIFNMSIINPFIGYAVYNAVQKQFPQGKLLGVGIAAWMGTQAAALACALQLAISGTSPFDVAVPAMLGVHALIGIGEALITVGAFMFIQQTRPDLLGISSPATTYRASWIAVGLALALAITFFSPLADPNPDGLEKVAEEKGFLDEGESPFYEILPDYTVPFIENEAATTIAAGVIGVLIVAGVGYGTGRANRRKSWS